MLTPCALPPRCVTLAHMHQPLGRLQAGCAALSGCQCCLHRRIGRAASGEAGAERGGAAHVHGKGTVQRRVLLQRAQLVRCAGADVQHSHLAWWTSSRQRLEACLLLCFSAYAMKALPAGRPRAHTRPHTCRRHIRQRISRHHLRAARRLLLAAHHLALRHQPGQHVWLHELDPRVCCCCSHCWG
jgi:hypothetical protein